MEAPLSNGGSHDLADPLAPSNGYALRSRKVVPPSSKSSASSTAVPARQQAMNGNREKSKLHVQAESDADVVDEKAVEATLAPPCQPQQPRFSKLTLPAKFDNQPLLTRLWLQSRTTVDKSKPENYGIGDNTPRRPVTWANFLLLIDIVIILFPHGWAWLKANPLVMLRLGFYLFGEALSGFLSAMQLWSASRLLSLMDEGMRGDAIPWDQAVWAGCVTVFFQLSPHIHRAIFTYNKVALGEITTKQAVRTCLMMNLAQTVTETHDTVRMAMVQEACSFSGLSVAVGSGGRLRMGSSADLLHAIGRSFDVITNFIGQCVLVYTALTMSDSIFSVGNAFILGMGLTPIIIRRANAMYKLAKLELRMMRYRDRHEMMTRARTLQSLATSLHYKPETLLYGLQNWILKEYDITQEKIKSSRLEEGLQDSAADIAQQTLKYVIDSVYQVLVVTRTAPPSVSLASKNTLTKALSKIFQQMGDIAGLLGDFINYSFNIAAFQSAYLHSLEQKGLSIDYETQRYAQGGMRVELRDVTFAYTGADQPAVKNINLTIEPGETVAIVGYNGSGKTTLLKLILGLYDGHEGLQGDLRINGHRIGDYNMTSFYARTSCVYQSFIKYPLSLRENVGVGEISYMDDTTAIEGALEQGGARGIQDQVGLDARLNTDSTSDARKHGVGPWDPSDDMGSKGKRKKAGKGRKEANVEKSARSQREEGENGKPDTTATGEDKDGKDSDDEDDERDSSAAANGTSTPKKLGRVAANFLSALVQTKSNDRLARRMMLRSMQQSQSLSGGQWQRVAIARAFLRVNECDLVALDEPSSALDPQAEHDLFKTLHSLTRPQTHGNRVTTMFVSHRLSTVRRCDRILVMDSGSIVEEGTWEQLMAREGGKFQELWKLQRDAFVD